MSDTNPNAHHVVTSADVQDDLLNTATHLSGHVLVGWQLPSVQRFTRVCVNSPMAGVADAEHLDRSLQDRWERIVYDLAGIAGEAIAYGEMRAYASGKECMDAHLNARRLLVEHATLKTAEDPPWLRSSIVDLSGLFQGIDLMVLPVLGGAYALAQRLIVPHQVAFVRIRHLLMASHHPLSDEQMTAVLGERTFPTP